MELKPKSLKIPLHSKDRFGFILAIACALVAACVWLVDAPFGYAFVAACVVVLPPLYFALLPPAALRRVWAGGRFGWVAVALLLAYIPFGKSVLLPNLLMWLHAYGPAFQETPSK